MARLYTNENFPLPAVEALRRRGHDVQTSYDSGNANQAIPDEQVLAYATGQNRILITFNRKHFIRLHASSNNHAGIITCTVDSDFDGLAMRINDALDRQPQMAGQLIRINRTNS